MRVTCRQLYKSFGRIITIFHYYLVSSFWVLGYRRKSDKIVPMNIKIVPMNRKIVKINKINIFYGEKNSSNEQKKIVKMKKMQFK